MATSKTRFERDEAFERFYKETSDFDDSEDNSHTGEEIIPRGEISEEEDIVIDHDVLCHNDDFDDQQDGTSPSQNMTMPSSHHESNPSEEDEDSHSHNEDYTSSSSDSSSGTDDNLTIFAAAKRRKLLKSKAYQNGKTSKGSENVTGNVSGDSTDQISDTVVGKGRVRGRGR